MIPEYARLIATRWGHMIALNCDTHQTASLFAYGEWAPKEVNLCLSMIERGATVLDVGANIGTFTLAFAHKVGRAGQVHAFEPQRLPFMCLAGNVVLNSIAEFTHPYRLAVSDSKGHVMVPNIDPKLANNVGGARMDDDQNVAGIKFGSGPSKVDCVRIDDAGLKDCHFIKIDVEGMEHKVLAGAADTVSRFKPKIFAEALPWEMDCRQAMFDFFKANDYLAWQIETPLHTDDNVRLCSDNGFSGQSDVNCIAVHKDQQPPAIVDDLVEFEPEYD